MGLHKLPTLKLILQKVNKDDDYGYIYLRSGIPSKKRYVTKSLGHKIPANCWDDENELVIKPHKDRARINELIAEDKRKLQKMFDSDYSGGVIFDESYIRSRMFPEVSDNNFIDFFTAYLLTIKGSNTGGYHRSFNTSFNTFKEFAGTTLPFARIDVKYLEQYESHLRTMKPFNNDESEDRLADTTIHVRMRHLKEVIAKAIKREHISYRQIDGYRWPKYEAPETHYLTLSQVNKIGDLIYKGKLDHNPTMKTVACFFLIEACSGIRWSDWGKFSVEQLVHNKNFKVRTTKTKSPVYLDLSVFKSLAKIVKYIQDNNIKFNLTAKTANEQLKSIGVLIGASFPLSTHDGRRSFGVILAELGYSDRFIGEAMGISAKTAATYIKITKQVMSVEQERIGGF